MGESGGPIEELQKALDRSFLSNLSNYWEVYPVRCTCNRPISFQVKDYEELRQTGLSFEETMNALGIRRYCCRRTFLSSSPVLMLQQDPETVRGHSSQVNITGQRDQIVLGRGQAIPVDPLGMARQTVPPPSTRFLPNSATGTYSGAVVTNRPVLASIVPPLTPQVPVAAPGPLPGSTALPGTESQTPISLSGVPLGNLRTPVDISTRELYPWEKEGRKPTFQELSALPSQPPNKVFVGYGSQRGQIVPMYTTVVANRVYGTRN